MRGFIHAFEAITAGLIMLLFVIAVASRGVPQVSGPNLVVMKANDILMDLDRQGVLRPYAAVYDTAGLNSMVSVGEYNHTVVICGQGYCAGTAPSAANVWTAGYITAGNGAYSTREVRLYLW